MPPDLIPARMTAEQQEGFRLACAAFARWGGIMLAQPTLPGTPAGEARAMRTFGRRLQAMATTLSAAMDRGADPRRAARVPGPADGAGTHTPAPPAMAALAPVRNHPAAGRQAGQRRECSR